MNRLGCLSEIERRIADCRERCHQQEVPFNADALAAALGISYETLAGYARGEGTSRRTAELLQSALQECTAEVLACALRGDAKQHGLLMWYLRNRAGFSDKGEETARGAAPVTFVGEGRI